VTKVIWRFGNGTAEGSAAMVAELGGKGAHLAEMSKMGIPVPAGFTIPTVFCRDYAKDPKAVMAVVMQQVLEEYKAMCLEANNPHLLVSVRSGAPVSMPGMMDTILNVGMTLDAETAWFEKIGKAALDCRRRLMQMLGSTAYGVPSETFEVLLTKARFRAKVKEDSELGIEHLNWLKEEYKQAFTAHTGTHFPDTVEEQLAAAVEAVFKSWNNERAITYRKINGIDDAMGTAVTVQTMVFGNLNHESGSGALFTRHPSTGVKQIMGEFLSNAQGEDVVAGIRTPLPLSKLATQWPEVASQIGQLCSKLEAHYRDMMDVEFTVQDRQLFLLQCRAGKRSALAKLQIAYDLMEEEVIDLKTALARITRKDVRLVLQPQIDPGFKTAPDHTGIGSTQGVASGIAVLTAEAAMSSKAPCILVRHETDPDDIGGMAAAAGILTRTGGATSHAAVVARAMNKPAVVGCTSLPEDMDRLAGKKVTIDGSTGKVWIEVDVPVIDTSKSPVVTLLADKIACRDNIRMEMPLDQFLEYDASCKLLVTDAIGCTTEQAARQEIWEAVIVDVRQNLGPRDPDGLGDLFALTVEPKACPVPALAHMRDAGAWFLADGQTAVTLKGFKCKVHGPAETVNDLLDNKTLDASPAVIAQFGAGVWAKMSAVLEKSGFTKSSVTACPPAYILMNATTEG
jgi:pyruvate,orthophosphate dikinase